MAVTMRNLLENGVHFGHQTRRWNPKMRRFILTDRGGIYIIDLEQSLDYLNTAYDYVRNTVAGGGSILFIGTKKQAQDVVAEQATRVGMPYVNERWLGGMLTNFQTITRRLQRLKELESVEDSGLVTATKKERLMLERERIKLDRTLGGIRTMSRLPAAVWVVDTNKEHIAVREARKLGIPVIAILDTNCDPDEVDFPIPANDDAIRSVSLLTTLIADAAAEGLRQRAAKIAGEEGEAAQGGDLGAAEPLAEWEQELLSSQTPESAGSPETPAAEVPAPETPAAEEPAPEAPAAEVPAVEPAEAETAQSAEPMARAEDSPGKADAS